MFSFLSKLRTVLILISLVFTFRQLDWSLGNYLMKILKFYPRVNLAYFLFVYKKQMM